MGNLNLKTKAITNSRPKRKSKFQTSVLQARNTLEFEILKIAPGNCEVANELERDGAK